MAGRPRLSLAVAIAASLAFGLVAPVSEVAAGGSPAGALPANTSPLPGCQYSNVMTRHNGYGDWQMTLLDTIETVGPDYYPPDLVGTGVAGGGSVRSFVQPDLAAMTSAAAAAGSPLQIASSFRSFATQIWTFNYWASLYGYDTALLASALAGHSEHQLGTAIDFTSLNGGSPWLYSDWAATPAGAWMSANAWRYGFVLSYPRGKTSVTCYQYEPWHYRYFGPPLAGIIHASGLTTREWLWSNGGASDSAAPVVFDATGYFTPDAGGAGFHAVTPTRILDTRDGIGGPASPLENHVARTFQVSGGAIPTNAIAVTGNLTVTQQTRNGFLFVGPAPVDDPTSSTLNFPAGDDRANAVTVALGDGVGAPLGSLSVTFVGSGPGTAQAVFDVTGYFTPGTGAAYHALSPARILDTRDGTGGSAQPLSNHVARTFQVTGEAGGVPVDAVAVTGNLTVTQQGRNGYLFIGPVPTNDPTNSTLNFPYGDDRANSVTVALGDGATAPPGTLSVTYVGSGPGTAQVIFDVTGYFTPDGGGATYHPIEPGRLLDTRDGTGGLPGPLASHSAATFRVTGSVIPPGATAVTGNLTVTGQTSSGYLFVGPAPVNNPKSSTLNFPSGDDRANGVTVALSGDGTLSLTFVAPSSG